MGTFRSLLDFFVSPIEMTVSGVLVVLVGGVAGSATDSHLSLYMLPIYTIFVHSYNGLWVFLCNQNVP